MNNRNTGKGLFIKTISIILSLALAIMAVSGIYSVYANEPRDGGAYSALGAYHDLIIEDYDDFYKAASSVILDGFHSYWNRAAARGALAADEYSGEYDEVSVNISSDNDIALSKELVNSVVAKWYVANIFYSDLKPEDREVNKELFLDFLGDQVRDDSVFSISSPSYDISSYEKEVKAEEEDDDYEKTEPETNAAKPTGPADEAAEPTAEPSSEPVTERPADLLNPPEDLPETTISPAAEDPTLSEPEYSEPETKQSEFTEAEPDTEDQELTESSGEFQSDVSDGTAGTPDVLFAKAGDVSRIRHRRASLFEKAPETVTAYTGTITMKISADLKTIGTELVNDVVRFYASADGITEKQIRDKISELAYELNVKYATAETVQSLLKAQKVISDLIDGGCSIEEVLGWYYIVGKKVTDKELSGLFIGSCGMVSRLADRGLFPKGLNVKDPYYWLLFYSRQEGASIHYMVENAAGYKTDVSYLPSKGDIVIFNNVTDEAGELDGIALVNEYNDAADTISIIAVKDRKLTETEDIMRMDANAEQEWSVLCYIHPAYKEEIGLNYTWPLPSEYSKVTSGFHSDTEWRIENDLIMHTGIDIECPACTPVFAVSDGRVVVRGWDESCGNVLIIEHDGIYSEYHHLSSYAAGIEVGALVEKGETVAFSGNTGSATTGAHLHYGLTTGYKNLWVNSGATKYQTANYIDPLDESAIECYFPSAEGEAEPEETSAAADGSSPVPGNHAEVESFVQ